MGITIIQKSDLKKKKPSATKALILAGGAVTGGSFKAGGLKALNDYFVDFDVRDFDIFVGISSGSLLVAPLVGGISPESILRSLDGSSKHFTPLRPWHYYKPNISEWLKRPFDFFSKLASLPLDFLTKGEIDLPTLLSILPSGLFDNSSIESYLRENIKNNKLTNNFKRAYQFSGKKLYICAMALDGAKRVVFGYDEKNDVTISEAVQASTAVPGFYKPARIKGVDYVDGGVQETANIDVAIKKGAELIVCYNPFRPYSIDEMEKKVKEKRLSENGVIEVLNQIFRAVFHSRLHIAIDNFRNDPKFKGDIILIEPKPGDIDFFKLNPMLLSNRIEAARLGFESVRNSIEKKFPEVKRIFASYGIKMDKKRVEAKHRKLSKKNVSEEILFKMLEKKESRKNRR